MSFVGKMNLVSFLNLTRIAGVRLNHAIKFFLTECGNSLVHYFISGDNVRIKACIWAYQSLCVGQQ